MASHSASPFDHGEGDDEYLLHGSESYVTNHRHLNELHRLSAFQQLTTKVPLMGEVAGSPMKMRSMTGAISRS